MACGIPLFLRSAIAGRASALVRVLSVGSLPAIGTVIYLASSRGAALTAAAAVLGYVMLSSSRWAHAAIAAGLGCAGSVVAVGLVTKRPISSIGR